MTTAVVRAWDPKKIEIRDEDDSLKMLSDSFHSVRKHVSRVHEPQDSNSSDLSDLLGGEVTLDTDPLMWWK